MSHLKGMQVVIGEPAIRRIAPVDEFCALLETRTTLPDEAGLIDAHLPQCLADGREGSLPDPQTADVRRVHERDAHAIGQLRAQGPGKIPSGNPTGGAAANDQNTLDHRATPPEHCGAADKPPAWIPMPCAWK